MIEFYPDIKWVHVAAVIASGRCSRCAAWPCLRAPLAMSAPLRYLSYTIDTVLLTAALMLVTILHQYPFVQAWLTVKVLLLVVYVVLGSYRAEARRYATRRGLGALRGACRVSVHRQRRARARSARHLRALPD